MRLAENLQILRKEMRLSQEELAEKCQVSRQAITKWESGGSVPTIDKLVFLADLYELSLDELVGRKAIDKYTQVKEYLKEFAASDVPLDEDDNVTAIVCRYLKFMGKLGVCEEDAYKGLKEIFLKSDK